MARSHSIQAAVWDTAYVNSLPDSSFAFIDADGDRHLPYKDKDGKVDLPHVRNALARLDQVKGMSDEERAKAKTKLQSALKNTKAADDMVLRSVHSIQASDDQDTLPKRVMLLRSGNFHTQKYGEVPISAESIPEYKANFDNGVGMADDGRTGIPVDFAHQSHLNAAFWIKGMEIENEDDGGKTLWGTNLEFSDSGRKALLGKEYKCISSDFYPETFGEWVDAESGIIAKNVLVGAALTNRPMFTGNKPVMASEVEVEAQQEAEATGIKTVIYVNASNKKEIRMNIDELRVKPVESLTGSEYKFLAEHKNELSADECKNLSLEAAEAVVEKPKVINASEVKGTEGVVSIQASDLKAMQDGMAEMQASIKTFEESNKALTASMQASEKEKMEAIVTRVAKRGAIKADRIESYTNRLLAAQGEDREALIADLEALASNPLLAHTYGSQQTEGSAAMDAEAEILKKAKELVASAQTRGEQLDIFSARKQVLAANEELEAKANEAVQASAGSFNPFEGAWGANATGLRGVNPEVVKR